MDPAFATLAWLRCGGWVKRHPPYDCASAQPRGRPPNAAEPRDTGSNVGWKTAKHFPRVCTQSGAGPRAVRGSVHCSGWVGRHPAYGFARRAKPSDQAQLLPGRGENTAVQAIVLIPAIEAQALARQLETLGQQLGELAFAAHATAEAAVVILAAA